MTKAAKHFGKDLQSFMRMDDTAAYIQALKANSVSETELTEAKMGRYHGGTWAHPKLAVFFARWLDTKFAVWCDVVIDDILRGKAEVVITKPEQSEILKMPTTLLEAGKLWLEELERAEFLKQQNKLSPRVFTTDFRGVTPIVVAAKVPRGGGWGSCARSCGCMGAGYVGGGQDSSGFYIA